MLSKNFIQFNRYEVNKIHFELSQYYEGDKEFQISPKFGTEVTDCENGEYKVQLSISLVATEENPIPFSLEIIMTGSFLANMDNESDEFKQKILHENTVAIMFPFLRAMVASLTTNANIQPLLLPVFNIAGAFRNDDESVFKK